jgi:hypothetical protein
MLGGGDPNITRPAGTPAAQYNDVDANGERGPRDPHYGTMSRTTEQHIRNLSPISNLIHALKATKVLNKSTATYLPWTE